MLKVLKNTGSDEMASIFLIHHVEAMDETFIFTSKWRQSEQYKWDCSRDFCSEMVTVTFRHCVTCVASIYFATYELKQIFSCSLDVHNAEEQFVSKLENNVIPVGCLWVSLADMWDDVHCHSKNYIKWLQTIRHERTVVFSYIWPSY